MGIRPWIVVSMLVAVGCTDGEPDEESPPSEPLDLATASILSPRTSGPGELEVRTPSLPDQVIRVSTDGDGAFDLLSTDEEVLAFVGALPTVQALASCPGDFDDLGERDSLCVIVESGASLEIEVTAVPATKGDDVVWSELDRFDAGCVAAEQPETIRCTVDSRQRLSPFATFSTPEPPPPPPEPGDCVATVAAAGSGGITAIERWGDQLIVGGSFLQGLVDVYPGPVAFDDVDGTTVVDCLPGPERAGFTPSIVDFIDDGDGGFLVSGGFDAYGGVAACANVARINPDRSVDTAFCEALPAPAGVAHIARDGSVLYVADVNEVFAFDLDSLTVIATSAPLDVQGDGGSITDLAVVGGTVYIAGVLFDAIGTTPVSGFGALDAGDLTALAFAPSPDTPVFDLAVADDELWVAGSFSSISGQARQGLAVYEGATQTLTDIDLGLDGSVSDVFVGPDGVWIGGSFASVGGTPRSGVALVGLDGALADEDLPLGNESETPAQVQQVVEADGVVTVTGRFDLVDGASQVNIARIERATGAVLPVTKIPVPFFNPALLGVGDELWIWAPRGVDLVERQGAAIWDPVTGEVDPLDFQIEGGQFRDVFVDGDVAYLTGFFTSVGGVDRNRIAAVDLTTGTVLPFAPEVDSTVVDIAFGPDTVYIGGFFDNVNGQPQESFAALEKSDGSFKSGFDVSIDADNVRGVVLFGGNVILGGLIQSINGVDRGDLVWIDAQTGANAPITTNIQTAASKMRLYDGELWVESSTSAEVSGLPEDDRFFAIDPATGTLRNWQPGVESGGIDEIVKIGDVIFIESGSSISIRGQDTSRPLWALDANTAAVLDFDPAIQGRPNTIFAYEGQLLVGDSTGQLVFVDPPM